MKLKLKKKDEKEKKTFSSVLTCLFYRIKIQDGKKRKKKDVVQTNGLTFDFVPQ
jgi:hypothetical protein